MLKVKNAAQSNGIFDMKIYLKFVVHFDNFEINMDLNLHSSPPILKPACRQAGME